MTFKGFTSNMIVSGVAPDQEVYWFGKCCYKCKGKNHFGKMCFAEDKYWRQNVHIIEMEENEQTDLFVYTVDCMEDGQEPSQVHTVVCDQWFVILVVYC